MGDEEEGGLAVGREEEEGAEAGEDDALHPEHPPADAHCHHSQLLCLN